MKTVFRYAGHRGIITPAPTGDSDYPNEPEGFTRLIEHSYDALPGLEGTLIADGEAGYWWRSADAAHTPYMSINNNGAGTQSPPTYLVHKFFNGLQDGVEPTYHIGTWYADYGASGAELGANELYVSVLMRVRGNASSATANDGTTYENQSTGTKLWYVPYMNYARQNHSIINLLGTTGAGSMSYNTSWHLGPFFSQVNATTGADPGGGALLHPQNVDTTKRILLGQWHQVEVYLKQNTLDIPPIEDGLFKLWIDGHLVCDYTDMRYCSTSNPKGFYQFHCSTVFGGDAGEVKTRDDYIDFDHVYMSGVLN